MGRKVKKTVAKEAVTVSNGGDNDANEKLEPRSRSKKRSVVDEHTSDKQSDVSEDDSPKPTSGRKKNKAASKRDGSESDKAQEEYEVEAIVGVRYVHGKRQFKVRWTNHGPESDVWCVESDLHCPELVKEYLNSAEEEEETTTSNSAPSKSTKKSSKEDQEEEPEYEVEKVLDVKFTKNNKRSFLIRWKGYSQAHDTWEPEGNLNCTELMEELMTKIEKEESGGKRKTQRVQKTVVRYDPTLRTSGRNRGSTRVSYPE